MLRNPLAGDGLGLGDLVAGHAFGGCIPVFLRSFGTQRGGQFEPHVRLHDRLCCDPAWPCSDIRCIVIRRYATGKMRKFSRVKLASTIFEAHPESNDLLILFSGRLPGFQMPRRFSWSFRAKDVPVNKLFIRDNFGLWYHAGLEGLTTGIDDTALHIANFVDDHGFDRVSTIGISSGGYAALLLGELIGANSIHSLSPRTRLYQDAETHADRNRDGVSESLTKLWARPEREEQYFDLRPYFEANPVGASVCRIYYDPRNGLDRFHAENLMELPGIEFERYPGTGHALGKQLGARPGFFQSVIDGR